MSTSSGSGDDGTTGYLGAGRLPKFDLRIEALGVLDEASAAFGLARAVAVSAGMQGLIRQIQRDLYRLMTEVASTPANLDRFAWDGASRVTWLEQTIDAISHDVELPGEFILPGDTLAGASLSIARTIVRRAERRCAELIHRGDVTDLDILSYLNRLSSLCFYLEVAAVKEGSQKYPTQSKMDPES